MLQVIVSIVFSIGFFHVTLASNACSTLSPTYANCFEQCNLVADVGGIDASLAGATCQSGTGLVFNGDGHATLTEIAFGGPVTISVWARFDSSTSRWASVFDSQNLNEEGNQYGEIFVGDPPNMAFHVQNTVNDIRDERVTLPFGSNQVVEGCRWNHIAVTAQGTDMKFYLNGALAATNSNGHEPEIASRSATYLGFNSFHGTPNGWMKGAISSVQLWNRSLTSSEISSFYGTTSAEFPTIAPCSFEFMGGTATEPPGASKGYLHSPMPFCLLVALVLSQSSI